MRREWVSLSASALVTGAMAMVLGVLLNPATDSQDPLETLQLVSRSGGQWLAMAVLFFIGSVALTLGLPAILAVFTGRGRRLGLWGVAAFSVGTVGTTGYAMVMAFFRALVAKDAIIGVRLDAAVGDTGLNAFLYSWMAGFYVGVLLIAIALLRERRTPTWVSVAMFAFVAMLPFTHLLGRVGSAVQMLALAVAFTGVAMTATSSGRPRPVRERVY